jgi:UDP-N-acetylmuramate dehydrogenase
MADLQSKLKDNYPLTNYTTLRIGGSARLFYQPVNLNDLILFLRNLSSQEKNIIWIGFGSNVLIRDSGIDGVVIHTKNLNSFEELNTSNFRVEAGFPCAKLAKYYPFLSGIPGTVGGALAMNAGAFGDEIWNYVVEVETINRNGDLKTRKPDDFKVGYRNVICPDNEWFVAGKFSFNKNDIDRNRRIVQELATKRAATQPIGELTCGSVFRNPPGDYAGRLIELCGLKGKRIGDAEMSCKHANFIVNNGKATADDVENLINHVRDQVKKQTGIDLLLEVKIYPSSQKTTVYPWINSKGDNPL